MNKRKIISFMGKIILIEVFLMIPSLIVALSYGDGDAEQHTVSQKLRLCKYRSSCCGKAGHNLKQCAEIAFKAPGKIKRQRTDQTDHDPRRSHNKISVPAADPLFRLSDPAEKNAQDQRRHHRIIPCTW